MAAFLCRVCGGALDIESGKQLCVCPYCETLQSVPLLDSGEKAELCRRAEQLRREFRYDKAIELYERLIRLSPTDADLYWALTLCRYGVEYSTDGNVIINRIQAHSVLSDEDYKLALKFAGDEARAVMERQAEQIDTVRRRGAELADAVEADKYDVYICAREADENGRRAADSVIAAELYSRLCAEGFRVFSPQITLEDKFGGEWEPYIFAALNSADVMIVVGTSADSFDEVWVRNAWSRFPKTIIPVVRGMSPSGLPAELSEFQALDMSRLGAENDLITAVLAVTGRRTGTNNAAAKSSDPLIRRAGLFLEDGDFDRAREIASGLLAKSPNNSEAYIILLLAEFGLPRENALAEMKKSFTESDNYRLAMRYGDEPLRSRLKGYLNRSLYMRYTAQLNAAEAVNDELAILDAAAELDTLGSYSNAAELSRNAKKKVADIREKHRADMYESAVKVLAESTDPFALRSAEYSLRSLGDYKDAAALAEECAAKAAGLTIIDTGLSDDFDNFDNNAMVDSDTGSKPIKKYLPFAVAGGAVFAAAAIMLTVVISREPAIIADDPAQSGILSSVTEKPGVPNEADKEDSGQAEKYANANAALLDGKYSEAELLFTVLGDYKDSAEKVSECKYQSAAALLESGEFDAAERAFERLGSYSNSKEMVKLCRYRKAEKLFGDGDTEAARELFKALNGKWESKDYINKIDYSAAEDLFESGEYKAARDVFETLGKYSDSAERFNESGYKYAAELMNSGDYSAAADAFEMLGDYNDSGTQYRRAQYNLGIELTDKGELKAALAAFEKSDGYGDTARQMRRVKGMEIRSSYHSYNFSFAFGEYYHVFKNSKDPLKWEVYTIEGDMALIYTCNIMDYMQFDSTDPNCTWQNSSLRRWLNGEFYENAFTDNEKAMIRTSVFETASGNYNYVGTSGSGISDKIFLLSTSDITPYFKFYGELQQYVLSIYTQQYKLPENYSTLFCWGRDKPLIEFYDNMGHVVDKKVSATSYNCVLPAMWVYIGD